MSYTKAGDAGHSCLTPDQGDFRGDTLWYEHPLDAAGQAVNRFFSYGNWSGPGNKFDKEIQAEYDKQGESYDPSKDSRFNKDTAVDGLDAAAREHDLSYYKASGKAGRESAMHMFTMDGLLEEHDADRKLQQDAAKEMDSPSIGKDGKPISYSDDTRMYADGMQGFFGGRADGVDIRKDYLDGKIDAVDAIGAGVDDVSKAYDKNGLFGAACETAGLANVAIASGIDAAEKTGAEVVNTVTDTVSNAGSAVADTASKAWDWLTN
jgi:hypothetical protein